MIDCGSNGNDTSADLYMAVSVHPPRQPNFTQKMKGGENFLFPTLLHFLRELLLKLFPEKILNSKPLDGIGYIDI